MIFIKQRNAFTLAELLVGITIIGILLLGVTNINFNRLSSKQKLEIFTNNIKTDIENIRNNSLEGKGIGTNLIVPDKWKIDFSMNNSGTILTNYSTNNGTSWIQYNNITFQNFYNISKIRCGEFNQEEVDYDYLDIGGTGSIIFDGFKLSFKGDSSCQTNKDTILELTIKNNTDNKKLIINTLNGLIEIK